MSSGMEMSSEMDMGSEMDDSMMMMQMTYYWGSTVTVLFDSWNTEGDSLYYSVTLIFLFLLAVGSEAWAAVSAYFRGFTTKKLRGTKVTSKIASYVGTREQNLLYVCGAFFYTIKLILGYQLMLAVMTYNVGISIAIFSGAFVGNFVFARFAWDNPYEEVDNIACHM